MDNTTFPRASVSLVGFSYGQLGVPAPQAGPVDEHADVRPHDGQPAREAGNGAEEVAEQHDDAVRLDEEADEGPPQEDEGEADEEGGGALGLLLAGEEEERLLRADDDGEADEEKDLFRREREGLRVSRVLRFRRVGSRIEEGGEGEGRLRTLPMASLRESRQHLPAV